MNDVKRLYRSRTDRVLAGVCGGVARYFAIDPVIVRVLWVVAAFMGVGIVAYIVAWIAVPEEPWTSAPPGGALYAPPGTTPPTMAPPANAPPQYPPPGRQP